MTEYVQLVGSDDPCASGSALLWSEEQRLMFNCPEGTQRFAGEIRLRLTKVNTFLFTRFDPHSFMGFPGVLFTINDAGVKQMQVVGDEGPMSRLWNVIQQYFFTHRNMVVTQVAANKLNPIRCGSLNVLPIACGDGVFSYLCSTSCVPKFDVKKAKALGVLPGPKYASLKRGNSVDSDEQVGLVVVPNDVMSVEGMSTGVLIADCRSPDKLPCLDELQSTTGVLIHTVVHVAPYDVVSATEYRRRVATLYGGPNSGGVRHVVAAAPTQCRLTAFPTALANRIHLHCIAPEFVLLPHTQDAVYWSTKSSIDARFDLDDHGLFNVTLPSPRTLPADVVTHPSPPQWRYGKRYSLRDVRVVTEDPLTFPTYDVARGMLSDELRAKITAFRHTMDTFPESRSMASGVSAVHFYGTGSAVPSKYRNVSCAAFEIEANDGVLVLDVGEGSLGQMWNHCTGSRVTWSTNSMDALKAYVARIGVVFISHFHADHHLGLFSLLSYRRCASAAPVTVMAPQQYVAFYQDMSRAGFSNALGDAVRFFVIDGFVDRPLSQATHNNEVVQSVLDFLHGDATVFHVDHPAWALGARFDVGGTVVVYSGDTQPCPSVTHYSAGADLLIHEATFAEGMTEEARQKRHSTVSEAIEAGAFSKALLLTHFSQRYPKLPQLDRSDDVGSAAAPVASTTSKGCAVGVAFDLLTVPGLDQMRRLACYTSMFQELAAEYDAWGDGTTKRLREQPGALERPVKPMPAT